MVASQKAPPARAAIVDWVTVAIAVASAVAVPRFASIPPGSFSEED